MQRRSHRAQPRVAAVLAGLVALVATAIACPGAAFAASHPGGERAGAGSVQAAALRVERYWTPARMRGARPLDLTVDRNGKASLKRGAAVESGASASFTQVATPQVAPFSFNGRVFIRQGKFDVFCSGTAINSPTRQLVLTAGHCVYGNEGGGSHGTWSKYLEFVPAYSGGVAPFGAFVARRNTVRAPPEWVKHGNPDFDMGAFLTSPNAEGVNVADAVGGGATIVTELSRHQDFQTFGYPGLTKRMQGCKSPYIGDDLLSNPLPGPPTMTIGCHWAQGASGGGWTIDEGLELDGITTYLRLENRTRTYGPYFSAENVGKLVQGL